MVTFLVINRSCFFSSWVILSTHAAEDKALRERNLSAVTRAES